MVFFVLLGGTIGGGLKHLNGKLVRCNLGKGYFWKKCFHLIGMRGHNSCFIINCSTVYSICHFFKCMYCKGEEF